MKNLICFVLMCCASNVVAQEVNVRFALIGRLVANEKFYTVINDKEGLELPLVDGSFTSYQKQKLVGDKIAIFKDAQVDVPSNQLTQATVPAESTSVTVVIVALPQGDSYKYAALAYDDSFAKFAKGTSKVINFTSAEWAFESEGLKVPVKAGSITDIPILKANQYGTAMMNFYVKREIGDWSEVAQQLGKYYKTMRYIHMATVAANGKSMQVKTFVDDYDGTAVKDSKTDKK